MNLITYNEADEEKVDLLLVASNLEAQYEFFREFGVVFESVSEDLEKDELAKLIRILCALAEAGFKRCFDTMFFLIKRKKLLPEFLQVLDYKDRERQFRNTKDKNPLITELLKKSKEITKITE